MTATPRGASTGEAGESDAAGGRDDMSLLPCPFCGGEAQFGKVPINLEEDAQDPNAGGEFIDCSQCQTSTALVFPLKGPVKRQLTERWNRRAAADRIEQLERELAVHHNDCPTFREFYGRHALGPKVAPSCLVCGESTHGKEIAIAHLELAEIVVCKACRDAALASASGTPPTEVEAK